MFIRKSKYKQIQAEIRGLHNCVTSLSTRFDEIRTAETDVLFGFASDIDKLKEMLSDFSEIADEQREAYKSQLRRDIGFQNMMNF